MKPTAILMHCTVCGQGFDLLNSLYRNPLQNTKWLHATGTGHHHFAVTYSDGTTKKITYRPSKKMKPMEYTYVGSKVTTLLKNDAQMILDVLKQCPAAFSTKLPTAIRILEREINRYVSEDAPGSGT